nr:MAG TPA: hypothetical protein [Caudoviricetes sp.]
MNFSSTQSFKTFFLRNFIFLYRNFTRQIPLGS